MELKFFYLAREKWKVLLSITSGKWWGVWVIALLNKWDCRYLIICTWINIDVSCSKEQNLSQSEIYHYPQSYHAHVRDIIDYMYVHFSHNYYTSMCYTSTIIYAIWMKSDKQLCRKVRKMINNSWLLVFFKCIHWLWSVSWHIWYAHTCYQYHEMTGVWCYSQLECQFIDILGTSSTEMCCVRNCTSYLQM